MTWIGFDQRDAQQPTLGRVWHLSTDQLKDKRAKRRHWLTSSSKGETKSIRESLTQRGWTAESPSDVGRMRQREVSGHRTDICVCRGSSCIT